MLYKIIYYRPAIQQNGTYVIFPQEYWIDCTALDPFHQPLISLNKINVTHFPYATCGQTPPGAPGGTNAPGRTPGGGACVAACATPRRKDQKAGAGGPPISSIRVADSPAKGKRIPCR